MSQFVPNPSVPSAVDYQPVPPVSAGRGAAFWVGWVLSVLVGLMLMMGGVMDLLKPPFVVEGLKHAGFTDEAVIVPLGVVTIISCLLFLIPRTAMFGAILLTAYLGGAVSIHLRLGEYGQMFAPVVIAVVLWVALVLRDRRVRTAVFG
ncbi:MAG: hypothetical protein JWM57_1453 [Phycisphaerales bacterium]|nr:hypothetical protein [Phycisphaerales bacterium]